MYVHFFQRYHSIILMAACDADYRFIYVDVGSPGSDGDMNVFSKTDIGRSILEGSDDMNFPPDSEINGELMPFFFVADDAFPLTNRIMKPFGGRQLTNNQKIFNYRLSRARRTIENAFGILVAKWGCLRNEFLFQPDKVKVIANACCALHNYLINRRSPPYVTSNTIERTNPTNGEIIEGELYSAAQNIDGLCHTNRGRLIETASMMRNRIMDYVCNEDVLDWQFDRAHCIPDE